MGSAYFNLILSVQNIMCDDRLLARLLSTIGQSLVRFKSIELHLVGQHLGQRSIFKHDLSIDGEVSFVHEPISGLLPGEAFSPVTDLTILADTAYGPTLPRDESTILDQLVQLRREAAQLRSGGDARRAWVVWYGWGLTRSAYINPAGGLEEGWFLRERLGHDNNLVPLLRVSAHFEANPNGECMLNFFSNGYSFSFFEPDFDALRGEWVTKEDTRAPRRNAQLLAEAVGGFQAELPGARFMWEIDREHRPDLLGSIPAEFVSRFGAPSGGTEGVILIP